MFSRWFNTIKEKLLSSSLTLENDSVLENLDTNSMPVDVYSLYQSAKNGNESDIFKLGLKYYHGQGVGRNCAYAYEIFRLLQDFDADAEYYMGEICRLGLIDDGPDYQQACFHYAVAMEMGHSQGKDKLQLMAELTQDEFWLGILGNLK